MDVEQLERDMKGVLVRETKHKLLIHGEYFDAREDLSFNSRKQGLTGSKIVVNFHGNYPTKDGKERFVWNYCELDKKNTRRLIRWLIEKEKGLK